VSKQLTISPEELIRELSDLWEVDHGQPPGELIEDLARLRKRWFGPKVTPRRVGSQLAELEPQPLSGELRTRFDPPLVLSIGERRIVTPEGRVAIELLNEGNEVSTLNETLAKNQKLTDTYRGWSQERLEDEAKRRESMGYPTVAAVALILHLHGAKSREHALRLTTKDGEEVDRELLKPLEAFHTHVGQRPGLSYTFNNYHVGKAQARFGQEMIRREPSTGTLPVEIWIGAPSGQLLDAVAEELVIRRELTGAKALAAIRDLIDSYDGIQRRLRRKGCKRQADWPTDDLIGEMSERLRQVKKS
jgi:hypothetical protein